MSPSIHLLRVHERMHVQACRSRSAENDGLPFTADLQRVERVWLRQMVHACQDGHVVFDEIPRSSLSTDVAVIAGFRSA